MAKREVRPLGRSLIADPQLYIVLIGDGQDQTVAFVRMRARVDDDNEPLLAIPYCETCDEIHCKDVVAVRQFIALTKAGS